MQSLVLRRERTGQMLQSALAGADVRGMGIFERLKTKTKASGAGATTWTPPRTAPTISSTWLQRPSLRAYGYRVGIVGESHYQDALEAACGGRTVNGAAIPLVTALLVREPTNPYDRNAVRVDVGGQTVGYLDRQSAPLFHGVLDALHRTGRTATCRACVTGGWDRGILDRGHFGLELDLHPDLQVVDNAPILPFGEGRVSVTGEEKAQSYLLSPLQGSTRVEVVAVISFDRERLRVTIGDEVVGYLTAKMSGRYWPWVAEVQAAGFEANCEARVVQGPNKVEAYLKLAKPWPIAKPSTQLA